MFPPRTPGSGPPAAPAGGPGKFLATRNGKIAAAVTVVAAVALYRRKMAAAAAGKTGVTGTDTSQTAGATSGTVDTSGTDLYNSLEPLIEHMSGFDGTSALQQQLAAMQAALLAALQHGPDAGIPPGEKGPAAQYHRVGKVGSKVKFTDEYKRLFPQATAAQLRAAETATEHDPRNARWRQQMLGNWLPGGADIWFATIPVPAAAGAAG